MLDLQFTYLQLAHSRLAEVFRTRVDTQCDEKSSVYAFFAYAAFAFLRPQHALLLEFPRLPLRLGLTARLQGGVAWLRAPPNAQERCTPSAIPRAVHAAS